MLSPEKVKTLLTHDDTEIRDEAIHYLERRHDRSMVTADDIWKAIDRVGVQHSARLLGCLDKFEQSDDSMQRLIHRLNNPKTEDSAETFRLLNTIPLRWVAKYREQILSVEGADLLIDSNFSERLTLPEKSADELWEMLLSHCKSEPDDWCEEFVGRGDFLVDAIARFGEPIKHRAIEMLQREREDSWNELFALRLLGQMRASEVVNFALPRLELYGDVGADDLTDALVNVATPELVKRLEDGVAAGNDDFAFSTTEILGRYPSPESQRLLLKLAQGWTDDRSIPCYHLLRQLPDEPEVLEFLRAEASTQAIEIGVLAQLDEEMLTLGKVLGKEFPESDQWRAAKADRGAKRVSRMLNDRADWEENHPQEFPLPVNPRQKVGRNDPCPCGSGKKYKKCCLDKPAAK